MILEGIVTTVSPEGVLNVAPMGPMFPPESSSFELRPFDSSQTYQNLKQSPCGVFHVTDDCLLIAKTAINDVENNPPNIAAKNITGRILEDCCRYYEFTASEIKSPGSRKTFHCSVVGSGRIRDFYGFNRAKHAVLEATILATRIDFIPVEEITNQFQRLQSSIEKTGGPKELKAFSILKHFVNEKNTSGHGER